MILTDDLGWNFPGYQNGEGVVKTPALDKLATTDGVRLQSSYMYKFCSPSRGAFMTGRYPWKMASTRCNFIPSSIPEGIDLDYTFLPKHLAKAGYFSAHIGKWHLGFHEPSYTPVARGFNTSYGFLEGGEDHWTHRCGAGLAQCDVPGTPKQSTQYWDLWSQSTTDFPGSPVYGMNGTKGDESTYSGFIFTDQAVKTIRSHQTDRGASTPLFMYLSLHNTHAPVEAPDRFVSMYNTGDTFKDTFYAMVSAVDETVHNVTSALKEAGMWDNSVVVWATDNGSPVQVAGSNHPLKGGKATNWEGGVRVPTFVTGGRVPSAMRGKELDGLVSVADWIATFSELAGLGPNAPPEGPAVSDSISMVDYLMGRRQDSPRTVLIHDHRMFTNASRNHDGDLCNGQHIFEKAGYDSLGAIRVDNFKLIIGDEIGASWYGEFSPNSTVPKPDMSPVDCVDAPCLYDLSQDPAEHVNIASTNPEVVARLW
eukprot:CAMPEP_0175090726 /NCGR_PEP_ID=MMETSP0086_2-20121207/1510_1 /TAXON_ID=136419 /ORGANISM="Unknown Unknown, Strain D1" /LENGTH=479 /DNA_ID=CAMNT_0016363395 /DNA_START=121 /DNA_END=1557 /DNA_ORIENTATION=-